MVRLCLRADLETHHRAALKVVLCGYHQPVVGRDALARPWSDSGLLGCP
jgi:hypothetical protein